MNILIKEKLKKKKKSGKSFKFDDFKERLIQMEK